MTRPHAEYDRSVFLNCPFDGDYSPIFEAVIFAVFDCGFQVRCALEIDDSGKRYGTGAQKRKKTLILDSEKYRYQAFISDIAGQDIRAHELEPLRAISLVRNWLRSASPAAPLPGGNVIGHRYMSFRRQLPALRRLLKLSKEDVLTFNDYTSIVSEWLKENA